MPKSFFFFSFQECNDFTMLEKQFWYKPLHIWLVCFLNQIPVHQIVVSVSGHKGPTILMKLILWLFYTHRLCFILATIMAFTEEGTKENCTFCCQKSFVLVTVKTYFKRTCNSLFHNQGQTTPLKRGYEVPFLAPETKSYSESQNF